MSLHLQAHPRRSWPIACPGHLFLPDNRGVPRIASYNARNSLATWLRAVIRNRAHDERKLRDNRLEPIEAVNEEEAAVEQLSVETWFRTNRVSTMITDCLTTAINRLTDAEREFLAARYVDGVNNKVLALEHGVHPSTITRRIDRLHESLRRQIQSCLASRYSLSEGAIADCVSELLEGPVYTPLCCDSLTCQQRRNGSA